MSFRLSGPVSMVEFKLGSTQNKTVQVFGDFHYSLQGLCTPCDSDCIHITELLDQSFQHATSQTDFFLETNWVAKGTRIRAQNARESATRYVNDELLPPLFQIRKRFHRCFMNPARCVEQYRKVRFHYADPRWDEGRLFALLISIHSIMGVRTVLSKAAALPGAGYALVQTGLLARNAILKNLDREKAIGRGKKIAAGVAGAYAGSKVTKVLMNARWGRTESDVFRLLDAIVLSDNFVADTGDILVKVNDHFKHFQVVEKQNRFAPALITETPVGEITETYHKIRKQVRKLPVILKDSVERFYRDVSSQLQKGRLPYAAKFTEEHRGVPGRLFMACCLLMDVYLISRMLFYMQGGFGFSPTTKAVVYVGDAHACSIRYYFQAYYPEPITTTIDIAATKRGLFPSRCLVVPEHVKRPNS